MWATVSSRRRRQEPPSQTLAALDVAKHAREPLLKGVWSLRALLTAFDAA